MNYEPHTILGYTVEGAPVTWGEIEDAFEDVKARFSFKLTTGTLATRLLYELAWSWCRIPLALGDNLLLVDLHRVLDEIGAIEKASSTITTATKAAEKLSGPLQGLWHKHWYQDGFLARNLSQEPSKRGLATVYRRWREEYGDEGWIGKSFDDKDFVGLTIHAAVLDNFQNRSGSKASRAQARLTGEWIVFVESNDRRIYLTLASHNESDEAILGRCLPAVREFPELADLKPFLKDQGP